MRDFYGTMAQVLPVVLLALVWESKYFDELASRPRAARFWTLQRVRVYALMVVTAILADLSVCALVLAGAIPDSVGLRAGVVAGLLLGIASLLFRIFVHVINATR
ncbi:hypothetical protein [Actinomadura rugatobispora]|uniref:DUF2516 family protein n=1 Tax=Actinomadura rugatobispora TaxID=1994 RepID=A0ABW1A728_9ACTN|nr:hypothetical protein GCM10010200_022020 [Actinomadura rugatobispora]